MTRHGILSGNHPATTQSLIQIVVGVAAIVLAIIGLAKMSSQSLPQYLDAVAGIVVGLGLLFVGWTVLEEYAKLVASSSATEEASLNVGGVTVELFVGGAAIILGVLALLQITPMVMISVQFILIGAGLVLNSSTTVRVEAMRVAQETKSEIVQRVSGEVATSAAMVQILAGLGALILGILALVGFASLDLTLAGAIVVGAALAMNGTSLSGWIISVLIPQAGGGEVAHHA
ncbi:MAG TPA: hypothetical protein VKY65_05140 [Alphaproteobacteria bacterium]|nr:hypothetical protein [Alphaproteobacteria bacterium]